MVEQIIAKGLHQADDDSKAYTIRLMDKLEQVDPSSSSIEESLKSYCCRRKSISRTTMPSQTTWQVMRSSSNLVKRPFSELTTL